MGVQTYRANLKATSFPMLTELFGRSVIMKGQDQNYVTGLSEKNAVTDEEKTLGVPQIFYAHNVIPYAQGYKSVGYSTFTTEVVPYVETFVSIVPIRDGAGNTALLANTVSGDLFIMLRGETKWTQAPGSPSSTTIAGKRMTSALVSGITYIYFENVGCYFYNFTAITLVPVTLVGLDMATLIGVIGSFGYLIAYSADSMAWSSTIDATDFTPSLATGAGGGQVEGAKGKIVAVVPIYGALIVFTDSNAVSASYSSNIRYPFNFTEVNGCGGLYDPDYVSYDTGTGTLHAYTTSGLQSVTVKQAGITFPEVTDFLSGGLFEDFDTVTNTFSQTERSGAVPKKVVSIADRYLVISYAITGSEFTHALIYDIALKQWGRLKHTHVLCFEMTLYSQETVETPRKSLGFLHADGTIEIANFDIKAGTSDGVILLGKYQLSRTRLLTMEEVELEGVSSTDDFSLHLIPTLDGKTFLTPVAGYLSLTAPRLRKYNFHTTGVNHTLLCKGRFTLNSLVLSFHVHGGR